MEAAELVVRPEEDSRLHSDDLRQSEKELRDYLKVLHGGPKRRPVPPKLVFEDGRELELSSNVVQALQFVLHHMARGDAIGLVPMNKLLTTNQAAEILNVSRPFLVKLLNEGAMKFTKIGSHHRLRMADVLAYKQRRNTETFGILDQLANDAQEAGNYFDD